MDKVKSNEKPFQWLAWLGTVVLIMAASMASFIPALEYHHWAFITANTIWVVIGVLWKETTVWVLNAGLTLIYILGLLL